MRTSPEFCGVIRWSESGSRIEALGMESSRRRYRGRLGAVPQVEADRLHYPERRARGEHVGRRQDAGVLLDDWCCGGGRRCVEKAPHGGPDVLAVLDEARRG